MNTQIASLTEARCDLHRGDEWTCPQCSANTFIMSSPWAQLQRSKSNRTTERCWFVGVRRILSLYWHNLRTRTFWQTVETCLAPKATSPWCTPRGLRTNVTSALERRQIIFVVFPVNSQIIDACHISCFNRVIKCIRSCTTSINDSNLLGAKRNYDLFSAYDRKK